METTTTTPAKRKIEKHSKKSCGRCGASGHVSNECRCSKDVECNKCHKKGHFAKMCRSKTSSTSSIPSAKSKGKHITSQLAHQEISSESEGEGDDSDVYFFRIRSPLQSALFPVKIGTQEFNLLIDSASTINIFDEKHFGKLIPSPVLKPSKTRIYILISLKNL